MTLKRLQIENFQNHHRLRIKFDENVTTIVGRSDIGKSAVIRALRWVATNKPLGNTYIKWGEDTATVMLDINGKVVKRVRGKSNNKYFLGDSKQQGPLKEFAAFGNEPPEEITNLVNFGEVTWQGQHDPAFWFSLTAGEVAKELNKVVDLEIIDEALAYLNSESKKKKVEADVIEKRLEVIENEITTIEVVVKIDKELADLERREEAFREKEKKLLLLVSTLELIEENTIAHSAFKVVGSACNVLGKQFNAFLKRKKQCDAWQKITDEYASIKQYTPIDLSKLEKKAETFQWLMGQNNDITALVVDAREQSDLHSDISMRLAEVEKELSAIEVCPTCERPL